MSSPERRRSRDDRKLTVIVVPHDELESRSYVIPYAKLRVLVILGGLMLLVATVFLTMLFPVMIQAANAGELRRQLEELEEQQAQMRELAQTLEQVEAQYEKVRAMLGADAAVTGDSTLLLPPLRADSTSPRPRSAAPDSATAALVNLWPLQVPGYITRALSDGRSQHPGLDIAVPMNSYIRAAGAGAVRAAGVDPVYGYYVVLAHGDSVETVYGHANKLLVTAGDQVERGQVIGLSGSSGRSTAPHLHFEVRRGGKALDPLKLVRQP